MEEVEEVEVVEVEVEEEVVEVTMIFRPSMDWSAASALATKPSLGERGSCSGLSRLCSALVEREGSLMTPTTTTTVFSR